MSRSTLPTTWVLQPPRYRGRLAVGLSLAGYLVVLMAFGARIGAVRSWGYAGVSSLSPAFADLRNITSAIDCSRLGFDPLVNDPCDPWQRPMNYPRMFLLLSRTGLGQRDTIWLGGVMIAVFALSALVLVDAATRLEALVFAAALCSPAAMLGVERANNDVAIFGVLVLALTLLERRGTGRTFAYGAIAAASMLKFYPIVAFSAALRERPKRAILVVSTGIAAWLVYLGWTWRDVVEINAAVPERWVMSYGRAVVFLALEHSVHLPHAEKLSLVVALTACLVVFLLVRGTAAIVEPNSRRLDAFRIGASIYVGTFMLGTNWDYRLLFLIFVVPQVVAWALAGGRRAALSAALLAAVLFSMWSALLSRWLPATLGNGVFALKELTNWTLFCSLLYLLLETLPPWVSPDHRVSQLRFEVENDCEGRV